MILTRRKVLLGALAMPSMGTAAPLFDIKMGGGLFSKVVSRSDDMSDGLRNLYNDHEPDLAPMTLLTPKHVPDFIIKSSMKLAFLNANTGEKMPMSLQEKGGLRKKQVSQLNHFLRDWRQNEIKEIDGAVLKTLIDVCTNYAPKSGALEVRITSGYRSKKTNNMLRRSSSKVARRSLHIQGRAIDFSLPNVSIRELSKAAKNICPGGVGTYSTFVHIDSGPKRAWGSA